MLVRNGQPYADTASTSLRLNHAQYVVSTADGGNIEAVDGHVYRVKCDTVICWTAAEFTRCAKLDTLPFLHRAPNVHGGCTRLGSLSNELRLGLMDGH